MDIQYTPALNIEEEHRSLIHYDDKLLEDDDFEILQSNAPAILQEEIDLENFEEEKNYHPMDNLLTLPTQQR